MFYFWLVLIGFFGGILGGMGMGGGTLLIPFLTIGLKISQQNAQAINLLAFLPMSIFALIVHCKNKLVKFKIAFPIIISGVISSVGGALLATKINSSNLKVWFGIFLIIVGVFQIVSLFIFSQKGYGGNLKQSSIK
ncbi:MAG: sulfite exporter TauE/SafE family protein [Clostridia bacterium]|nr:sulfite exporter TauE/SafE family protein [Clostridia bacterium]